MVKPESVAVLPVRIQPKVAPFKLKHEQNGEQISCQNALFVRPD